MLGFGSRLIDEAIDYRYGVVTNEESGQRLDELLDRDTELASALSAPELGAEDLELLGPAGWLWYLEYLIPTPRLPSDGFLLELWGRNQHELMRFRMLDAIIESEASAGLDEVRSLDELQGEFFRTLLRVPRRDVDGHPVPDLDPNEIENVVAWLYQIGSSRSMRLLRVVLSDDRTSAFAREVVEPLVSGLGDDPAAAQVREQLGL